MQEACQETVRASHHQRHLSQHRHLSQAVFIHSWHSRYVCRMRRVEQDSDPALQLSIPEAGSTSPGTGLAVLRHACTLKQHGLVGMPVMGCRVLRCVTRTAAQLLAVQSLPCSHCTSDCFHRVIHFPITGLPWQVQRMGWHSAHKPWRCCRH